MLIGPQKPIAKNHNIVSILQASKSFFYRVCREPYSETQIKNRQERLIGLCHFYNVVIGGLKLNYPPVKTTNAKTE